MTYSTPNTVSKDNSRMDRVALDRLNAELEQQRLGESAALYAEVHALDTETREWIDDVAARWPE